MNKLATVVGYVVIVTWLLGALGAFDFTLSITEQLPNGAQECPTFG